MAISQEKRKMYIIDMTLKIKDLGFPRGQWVKAYDFMG